MNHDMNERGSKDLEFAEFIGFLDCFAQGLLLQVDKRIALIEGSRRYNGQLKEIITPCVWKSCQKGKSFENGWDALKSELSAPQIHYFMDLIVKVLRYGNSATGYRLRDILPFLRESSDELIIWEIVSIFPNFSLNLEEWMAEYRGAREDNLKIIRNGVVSWKGLRFIDWRIPLPHNLECPWCEDYKNLNRERECKRIIPRTPDPLKDFHFCSKCDKAWIIIRKHTDEQK